MNFNYDKDSKEKIPYEHYLALYQKADPLEISRRTGIPYDEEKKEFTLRLMGTGYRVSYPDYTVLHLEERVGVYPLETAANARILILRYLVEGVEAPSTGKFLTYREIPWGEVYFKQFQGRCISRLAFGFGSKLEAFAEAMEKIGGEKLDYGDMSYEFEFLNNLRMRFILWAGTMNFHRRHRSFSLIIFQLLLHRERIWQSLEMSPSV